MVKGTKKLTSQTPDSVVVCSLCKKSKHWQEFVKAKYLCQCKECHRNLAKERRPRRASTIRNNNMIRNYGITVVEFDSILAAQGNRCAICRTDTPGGPHNQWAIDHSHTTKKIRGLLCSTCNLLLGHAKDRSGILQNCIFYLRYHDLSGNTGPVFKKIREQFGAVPRGGIGNCK